MSAPAHGLLAGLFRFRCQDLAPVDAEDLHARRERRGWNPHQFGRAVLAVPTDPLIYRFYEAVNVYGDTMKELIHEKFGDGIMSAIDFTMDIEKIPDPKGDRVKVTWNGKFLPYKSW